MVLLASFWSLIFISYLSLFSELSVAVDWSFNCKKCSPEVELVEALSKQLDDLGTALVDRNNALLDYIAAQTAEVKLQLYDLNNAQERATALILKAIEDNRQFGALEQLILQSKVEVSDTLSTKMNNMESNIMDRMDYMLQLIDKSSADITNQVQYVNDAQGKGTELIMNSIKDLGPFNEMQIMVLNLEEQHLQLQKTIESGLLESQRKLEAISKVLDSKFDTMINNTKKFGDYLKATHDLTTTSILMQKESKDCKQLPRYKDCYEVYLAGFKTNGVYHIYTDKENEGSRIKVFCDMTTSGGGWTVLLRRSATFKPRINFNRNWAELKSGFGELDEEHWIGLKTIHALTSNGQYKLRVDLVDFDSDSRFAEYSTFSVGNEETQFVLNLDGYSGNAGDSLIHSNGMKFTTKDVDNDLAKINCAAHWQAPGWQRSCYRANLLGLPREARITNTMVGIMWPKWRGTCYSYKEADMKIRPV